MKRDQLPIPEAAFAQHAILLGKTRSGKSSAMRRIVEGELDAGQRVCIIDPKGDWYGLRVSADGKSAGYPVVIFGGEHADVPLNQHAGAHVAELVATGNRPCIIDLGGWSVGERTRFFIDFASTLFRTSKAPMKLVIDEVHNFAPQGKIRDPQSGQMIHWSNRLASEGQGKGIILLAASQRPQKVHKDFVTSCETLLAFRVIHPLDRNAIKEWIDGCPDRDKGKQVLETLATMPRGEAWVWSPEIGFGPERVKFPMFGTFDSFAAPTAGQQATKLKGWAEIDLDEVKAKLQSVVEEAKANDPKELRKQLAALRGELAKAKDSQPAPARTETKTIEKFVLKDGQIDRIDKLIAQSMGLLTRASELQQKVKESADTIAAAIQKTRQPVPQIPQRGAHRPTPAISRPISPPASQRHESSREFHPNGSQQRVLNAIARFNSIGVEAPSKSAVGLVAGIKPTGGHFSNTVGPLSSNGLIEYTGEGVRLTAEGAALAEAPASPTTMESYHQAIRTVLRNGATQRIFDAILAGNGEEMTIDQIGQATGIDASGGHFSNSIGPLGTLGLIERRSGVVRPTELMFPAVLV